MRVCQALDEGGSVPRSSEEQLSHAYHLLMAQLRQDHAEVRLSAFQVLDQLFTRSHQFRMLVVSNFQEFLELTLGTNHERPLPLPRDVAQRLRQAATQAVRGWNEKYGSAYKKLAVGFHFLRHSKQVSRPGTALPVLEERRAWPWALGRGVGGWTVPGMGRGASETAVSAHPCVWVALSLWALSTERGGRQAEPAAHVQPPLRPPFPGHPGSLSLSPAWEDSVRSGQSGWMKPASVPHLPQQLVASPCSEPVDPAFPEAPLGPQDPGRS